MEKLNQIRIKITELNGEIKWLESEKLDIIRDLSKKKQELDELRAEYHRVDREMAMTDGRHQIIPTGRSPKTNTKAPTTKKSPTTAKLNRLIDIFGRDQLVKILSTTKTDD